MLSHSESKATNSTITYKAILVSKNLCGLGSKISILNIPAAPTGEDGRALLSYSSFQLQWMLNMVFSHEKVAIFPQFWHWYTSDSGTSTHVLVSEKALHLGIYIDNSNQPDTEGRMQFIYKKCVMCHYYRSTFAMQNRIIPDVLNTHFMNLFFIGAKINTIDIIKLGEFQWQKHGYCKQIIMYRPTGLDTLHK